MMFVIFAQAPAAAQPRQRPFHYPSAWQYHEPDLIGQLLDNLDRPLQVLLHPGHKLALGFAIAAVSPQHSQVGKGRLQAFEEQFRSFCFTNVRRMHLDPHQMAARIHHDVPLAPTYLFFPRRIRALRRLRSS